MNLEQKLDLLASKYLNGDLSRFTPLNIDYSHCVQIVNQGPDQATLLTTPTIGRRTQVQTSSSGNQVGVIRVIFSLIEATKMADDEQFFNFTVMPALNESLKDIKHTLGDDVHIVAENPVKPGKYFRMLENSPGVELKIIARPRT